MYELESSDVDDAEVDPDEFEPEELVAGVVLELAESDELEVVEAHPANAETNDRPTAAAVSVFDRGMRFMVRV